jgi:signal transduction histidine kinase
MGLPWAHELLMQGQCSTHCWQRITFPLARTQRHKDSLTTCKNSGNVSFLVLARISHKGECARARRWRVSPVGTTTEVVPSARTGIPRTRAGVIMANPENLYGDRRERGERRSGRDQRGGKERRSGLDRRWGGNRRCNLDRRSGKDRRSPQWGVAADQRFQGVLRTAETVSHLFSQPLTVITGHVDLLAAETQKAEIQNKLSIIKKRLRLLSTYLENLRGMEEFRTMEFAGLTLLDITSTRTEDK